MKHHILRLASTGLFLFFATSVWAQTPTPSLGVPLPDTSIVTRDDATAIETNPAGLGFMRTVELGYGFRLPSEDLEGVIAEGHALFLAMGAPFLGGGFGVQWLTRPDLGGDQQNYRKYSFALGTSMRSFAFGSTINWFGSSDDAGLDDLVTVDIGMQWRIREWLGFGFTFNDANTPFITDAVSLPLRYKFGAAVRLFNGRVVLDPSFAFSARERYVLMTPRLVVEPINGLKVFGSLEYRIQRTSDVVNTDFQSLSTGLSFSLGSIGGDYAAQFETTEGNSDLQFAGISAYTWVSPFKQRSLIKPKKWIYIDLTRAYSEQPSKGLFSSNSPSFLSMLNKIRNAAEDPSVVGLVVATGDGRTSWAQAWELRNAIMNARDNGKKTLGILGKVDFQQYYIASSTETIWSSPADTFHIGGLRSRTLTIRQALENLGVEAQFVRIGDYKSAPEMFLADTPSNEASEQREAYVDEFWDEAIEAIAKSRNKTREEVEKLANSDGLFPDEAKEQGWVDALIFSDEADTKFKNEFGTGASLVRSYPGPKTREERWSSDPAIAVLVIEGNIVSGSSGSVPFLGGQMVGDQSVVAAIDALRKSPRVKAVVLRINSPGGSAAASDRMYRALRRLAAVKPVIASMGGTAASGGYYVAAGADEIWAVPTTVTGSIGIFTGTFNALDLFAKIGIKQHQIERGNPVAFSAYQRWDDQDLATIHKSINYLYRLFLNQAASTRPIPPETLDAVARGRVWTGKQAKEKQLVDHVGGYHDAIDRAKELAGLEHAEVDVSIVNASSGSISLDFVVSKQQKANQRFLQQLIAPFSQALAVPLLYQPGEALMLDERFVVGSQN